MTDRPSPLNTHTAPSPNPPVNGISSDRSGQALDSAVPAIEEEEDYTIKCFCGFQVDDGNTVFCDRCETWQHIECYYFEHYRNGMAPDVTYIDHACVDCSPRAYDKRSAIERQKDRFWPGERKVKKAPAKPVKRRGKPSESHPALTNGYSHEGYDQSFAHERTSGSPKDHGPPAKRPKTSHRNTGKTPKQIVHHPSVNDYFAEPPSPEFLRLYDNDPGDCPLSGNIFNDIAITRSLSLWSHDVESLSDAANGLTPAQIFHRLDGPLDTVVMPQVRKERRVETSIEIEGRHPQWMLLTTVDPMARESIVGELRGKIGHMGDYCQDNANRWDYLRHPAPFVFFHPKLPIYIDTRQAGSTCRYLRRSCRPNVELRTILENGSDYRFIFIAKENLEAGAELTISWTTDEHIRRWINQFNNDIKQEGAVDAEAAYVSDWVQKVLSNFGGCACESSEECFLTRWLRPRDPSINGNAIVSNGKSAKAPNEHVKVTSTPEFGNGMISRASSEGMKRTDDEDQDNSRSTSGSKTPNHHGSGVPTLEISDREKRKIAAAEKTFGQIEQERQQSGPKRKKRSSGGSNLNTPTAATSVGTPSGAPSAKSTDLWGQKHIAHGLTSMSQPNTPSFSVRPRYADASSSCKNSGSPVAKSTSTPFKRPDSNAKRSSCPNTPSISSPLLKQNYVHSSVQTDAEESNDWDRPILLQRQKRKVYISLGKRLLMRCQQDREQVAQQKRISLEHASDIPRVEALDQLISTTGVVKDDTADMDTENDTGESVEPVAPENPSPDVPVQKPRPPDKRLDEPGVMGTLIKPPPPPSATAAIPISPKQAKPINGFRSSELRVQLPSAPHVSHETVSASPIATMTTPTITRSPFPHTSSTYPPLFSGSASNVVAPSPVKKVSLGEYFSRRKTESQISTDEKAAGSMSKGLGQGDEGSKLSSADAEGATDTAREESGSLIGRKSSAP